MQQITQKNPSKILTDVVEKLSLANDMPEISRIVSAAARELSDAQGACFVLKDEDRCYYFDENAISPLWKGKKFSIEACISGWSILKREVVCIQDIYLDSRIPQDAYRPTFVKSLCMVPIRREDPIGAIGNYWQEEYTPTVEEIKSLQILANSAAVAIENYQLKRSLAQQNSEKEGLAGRAQELESALYTMAHDLRNPLASMMGLGELLQMQLGESADLNVQRYLVALNETGRRASSQIEKMLALYRVSNRSLDKKNLNITDIANQIIVDIKSQYPERTVDVEIESGLTANADTVLVHMVLENLFSNAVKYSSKKPFAKIRLAKAAVDQGLATFFVQDEGDGFDQDQAHLLFKPLARLHDDKDFQGTGLGLASVARIIEVHGGKVRAEGRKSQGATFYFSLPSVS